MEFLLNLIQDWPPSEAQVEIEVSDLSGLEIFRATGTELT